MDFFLFSRVGSSTTSSSTMVCIVCKQPITKRENYKNAPERIIKSLNPSDPAVRDPDHPRYVHVSEFCFRRFYDSGKRNDYVPVSGECFIMLY